MQPRSRESGNLSQPTSSPQARERRGLEGKAMLSKAGRDLIGGMTKDESGSPLRRKQNRHDSEVSQVKDSSKQLNLEETKKNKSPRFGHSPAENIQTRQYPRNDQDNQDIPFIDEKKHAQSRKQNSKKSHHPTEQQTLGSVGTPKQSFPFISEAFLRDNVDREGPKIKSDRDKEITEVEQLTHFQVQKRGRGTVKPPNHTENFMHVESMNIPQTKNNQFLISSSSESAEPNSGSSPKKSQSSNSNQRSKNTDRSKASKTSQKEKQKSIKQTMANQAINHQKFLEDSFKNKRQSVYYARRPSSIIRHIEANQNSPVGDAPDLPKYLISQSKPQSPKGHNLLSPRKKMNKKSSKKLTIELQRDEFNFSTKIEKVRKSDRSAGQADSFSNHEKSASKDRRFSEVTIPSVKKLSLVAKISGNESQKAEQIQKLEPDIPVEKLFEEQKSSEEGTDQKTIEKQIEMQLEVGNSESPSQVQEGHESGEDCQDQIIFEDPSINQLIHSNRESGSFADLWSKIILGSLTYNFITAWYFLGMEGFPEGPWLTSELIVEMIILSDFILRQYLRHIMPSQFKTMWLLQHQNRKAGKTETICYLIASIPQSFIFSIIFRGSPAKLRAFPIAALRHLKLLRFPQITKFFETKEIENHSIQKDVVTSTRTLQVVFFFLLATHMIGCIWLVIGRIDPNRQNWFVMARYSGEAAANNVREVSEFEKYVDSVFYAVATMTGLGYGNIVPSTNLEYFVDIFIMITGSSIYAGFFADFAVEIYNQNKKTIENEQKLEQALQFAIQRNLPADIRERIRMYYNNMRLNFQLLNDKYSILHQLPLTLRSELSLFFNCELIQKVKFFQLSDPAYILAMSRCLIPQICLQYDFVVEVDQVANKMYFIQQGIVQILATDSKTVIAFQSQGCYFGEIGILLTNKRSCSVKAVSKCSFMTITKEQIEKIFENFPAQGKFLRAIGRQRLQTTKAEDLDNCEENMFDAGDGENIIVQDSVFAAAPPSEILSSEMKKAPSIFVNGQSENSKEQLPSEHEECSNQSRANSASPTKKNKDDIKANLQLGILKEMMLFQPNKLKQFEEESQRPMSNVGSMLSSQIDPIESWQEYEKQNCFTAFSNWIRENILRSNGLPWHLRKDYADVTTFVIIPFSRLYNIWTTLVVASFLYFLFIVPYQLALDYDILEDGGWIFIPDILCSVVLFFDIFFRSKIAFVVNKHGESNIQTENIQIYEYYVNNLLLWDILAALPLDYILLPFSFDPRLLRALRVLRFFKLRMFFQFITILRKHSNVRKALITFSLFFLLFIVIAHFMATIYIFIGKREVNFTRRFDGQTMFKDITSRSFINPSEDIEDKDFEYLPPATEMTKFELYIQFVYLSSCTMGAVMYGDIIPFAMSEQLFDFVAMFTCRIFLAFLFAEAASYLSSVHNSQSQHTMRVNQMMLWCDQNQFPDQLKCRIRKLYDTLWQNFKGVRQQTILQDLPESLQQDVRCLIFKNIIEKWDIFLDKESDKGAVSSIISQLELRIIPSDEFIIRQGETAQHMYFIIKGKVNIISSDGIHLAEIGEGKNFGEMALLKEGSVRSASVQAETDVSVAIMSTTDFNKICDLYPQFKEIILEVAEKRAKENKTTIKAIQQEEKMIRKNLHLSISVVESFMEEEEKVEDTEAKIIAKPGSTLEKTLSDKKEENQAELAEGFSFTLKQPTKQIHPDFAEDSNESLRLGTQMGEDYKSNRPLLGNDLPQPISLSKADIGANIPDKIDKDLKYNKKQAPKEFQDSAASFEDSPPVELKAQLPQLNRRFSRISLRSGTIQDHFDVWTRPKQKASLVRDLIQKSCQLRDFMKYSILILSTYNLIFTPLQFAYRIDYKGIFAIMELFTVVIYLFDIYYRKRNLQFLTQANGNIPDSTNEIEQTLMDDKDQFLKRLILIRVEITCSAIALVPFAFIFQICNIHEPQEIIISLSMLRLVKILPLLKMFDTLKVRNMKKYRVIEVVVLYYLICHSITGIWIAMANSSEDARETWIRRIPVLQPKGMRESADKSDITPVTLYIHGLYFIVNTVSHVAIGDITAVNSKERVFVAVLILFGTFIYCFLYGNIVSIVSEFAPNQEIAFIEKYKYVMQRLDSLKQERLMKSINEYFDFIWGNDMESYETKLMKDLPHSIKSDIMLCKYQEAIESSLIFKDEQGAIDVSLTNSIISMFKIRLYLSDEFVFRLGSKGTNTFFLIEGKTVLVGACDPIFFTEKKYTKEDEQTELELLGFMHVGTHFGNNLPTGIHNYNNTRICHMVARQPTVMGIISIQDISILYKSFPQWKQKMQQINSFTFKRCDQVLDKYDTEIKSLMSEMKPKAHINSLSKHEIRLLFFENHFTYTDDCEYSRILRKLKYYEKRNFLEHNNLLLKHKMFYYGQKGKIFPIFDNQYAKALKQKSHQSLISQVYEGVDRATDQNQDMATNDDLNKVLNWVLKKGKNFYFTKNSMKRKIIDIIQILNLMYIAIVTPLTIGFRIEITMGFALTEVVSLIMSVFWIIINFRTQILIKGVSTLKFKTVFQHYKLNGLLLDFCGILPFNLILGKAHEATPLVMTIRALLRAIRVVSSWKALYLFRKAEATFKNNRFNVVLQILKAILFISFLGHILACTFFFVASTIDEGTDTWMDWNGLRQESKSVCYLRSIYTVFNIVCSVGYGDMFPMNDTERVFFTMMITMGDLLFALAFGLITKLTLEIALTDETKQFKERMYQIQEFMKQFNLDQAQQRRVEQYFAYEYQQKYNTNLLSYSALEGYLPWSLRQRVKYRVSRKLLQGLFSEYESENFLRKLAIQLTAAIFLPGDYIMYKGEIGEDMYFMAEGQAYVLLEDKQTVVQTLKKGDHFGELALLIVGKRTYHVQAKTFCIVNVLTKKDFDQVIEDFPDIQESIKERKTFSQEYYNNIGEDSDVQSDTNSHLTIFYWARLNDAELSQFHEDHIGQGPGKRKLAKKRGLIDSCEIIHEERSSQFNSSSESSSDTSSMKSTLKDDEIITGKSSSPTRSSPNRSHKDSNKIKRREIVIQEPEATDRAEMEEEKEQNSRGEQQQSTSIPFFLPQQNQNIIIEKNDSSRNLNSAAFRQSGEQISSEEKGIQEQDQNMKCDDLDDIHNLVDDPENYESKSAIFVKTGQQNLLDMTHSPKSEGDEEIVDFARLTDNKPKDDKDEIYFPQERRSSRASRSQIEKHRSFEDNQVRRFSILDKESSESIKQSVKINDQKQTEKEKLKQSVKVEKNNSMVVEIQRPSSMQDEDFAVVRKEINSFFPRKSQFERKKTFLKGSSEGNLMNADQADGQKTRESFTRSQTAGPSKFVPLSLPSQNLLSINNAQGLNKTQTMKTESQGTAIFGGFEKQLSMRSSNKSFQIVPSKPTTITSQPALGTMFKKQAPGGKGEEYINHTIRRTITVRPPTTPDDPSSGQKSTNLKSPEDQKPNMKPVRRLSRISLGKNLTLSQTAGLKLQWTVGA